MMIIFILCGFFVALIGLLLFINPSVVKKMNDFMNKTITKDEGVYSHKNIMSVIFMVVGLLMIVTAVSYL